MRKLYFTLVAMMLLIAGSAQAAVTSMTDLFGKWKFTATVEVTEAGQAFANYFAAESEVVITKDAANIYDAQITGFAGAQGEAMKVNMFSEEKQMFKVNNPSGNSYNVWGNGIYYSNEEGIYPFGNVQLKAYYFTISEDAQTITSTDFTLVNCNYTDSASNVVLARFSNVKMELIEREEIAVPAIEGEWTVKAGSGTWDTMDGSELPTQYAMALAKNGSDRDYKATITIDGVAPFTLDATFNGSSLVIPFDSTLVDADKGYYIVSMYGGIKGNVSFNYINETTLAMANSLVLGTLHQVEAEGEVKDSIAFVQWWMNGVAKLPASGDAIEWAGTYNVTAEVFTPNPEDAAQFPTEFQIVIGEAGAYGQYITTFISDEVYIMNQGGIKVETDSENPNALIIPTAKYIKGSGDMMWWYLKDMNGSDGNLRLEAQSDGTLKLSDFSVYNLAYDPETWAPSETFLAFYQNAVATKATTGIQGVVSTAKKNGAIYDLQGRRVEKALKGIYIVDGKKIVK